MEINTNSLYRTESCTNFTGGFCHQTVTILSMGKQELKEFGTSVIYTGGIFIMILMAFLFLIKFLFNQIKGKR